MKPWKEVIDGIRNAVLGKEVREDIAQMGEYVEQFANTAGENIQKAIDPTLSLSGKAADAKATGDAVGQLKEDIVSNAKRNRVNLGAQKVVRGSYYLDRGFSQTDYYTWYFDLSPYNTGRYIVTASSPAYTNFVTFLDESMNTVGYVKNSSSDGVVKSEMYVTKPENAKYIAITTGVPTLDQRALLVSACISIDEIQGVPFYTNDNGEDADVYPIIILKGTVNNGKLDSSYVPNTTKERHYTAQNQIVTSKSNA